MLILIASLVLNSYMVQSFRRRMKLYTRQRDLYSLFQVLR